MVFLQILLVLIGLLIVGRTLLSAVVTFVLPRAVVDPLTRFVFLRMSTVFRFLSKRARSYEDLDRRWALFAPVTLLILPFVWALLIFTGFAMIFWGMGVGSPRDALRLSGSSFLTLGFAVPSTDAQAAATFAEAAIGLTVIALLIAYLPTIYSAWSRRESLVAMLATRAGTPPTPFELFSRYSQLGRLESLTDLWAQWEVWFTDIEESHTSLAALALFRSARPERSWVVSAGCVLDSASLSLSVLALARQPEAAIAIRAGSLALRQICGLYRIPYNPDPHYPADPIGVSREEFDAVCEQLLAAGVPLVEDHEQAWLDWAGWRVNYDETLRIMAGFTYAPPAPWSSDRATYSRYSRRREEQ